MENVPRAVNRQDGGTAIEFQTGFAASFLKLSETYDNILFYLLYILQEEILQFSERKTRGEKNGANK